jgi:translation initiation factor 2 subunit 1
MSYYYKSVVPKPEDVIFGKVKNITDSAIYITLTEYNDREGLIMFSEITKGKRSINFKKFFKPDTYYPFIVISADDKTIDLSYKRLTEDDIEKYTNKFQQMRKLLDFFTDLEKLKLLEDDEDFMNETFKSLFPDSKSINKDLEDIYQGILENPSNMFLDVDTISSDIQNKYNEHVHNSVKVISDVEMYKDIELTIFETNGLKTLKDILKNDESINVKISCISSPIYRIFSKEKTVGECLENINKMIDIIKDRCKSHMKKLILTHEPVIMKKRMLTYRLKYSKID